MRPSLSTVMAVGAVIVVTAVISVIAIIEVRIGFFFDELYAKWRCEDSQWHYQAEEDKELHDEDRWLED